MIWGRHWMIIGRPSGRSGSRMLSRKNGMIGKDGCLWQVACLAEEVEQDQEDFPFYYVGNRLSGPLDNAMQAYGSSGGVQRDQVVLLCDSTHSVLWGEGEQGFLITRNGQLISSQGIRVSLDQMGPVEYENNALVEAASGTVLAHFKTQELGDEDFCSLFNEIVLLPHAKKQEAEEPSAPREEPPAARPVPGSEEKRVCSRCGAPVKPGARFCAQCGNPLEPQGVPEDRSTEEQGQNSSGKDNREAILAFCREFQENFPTHTISAARPISRRKNCRTPWQAMGPGADSGRKMYWCSVTVPCLAVPKKASC